MAASHLLLQPPPQLHLQVVAIGGHAEMYIKKPMVHRLERQSETELAVDLPFHLREPGHGADRHIQCKRGRPRPCRPRNKFNLTFTPHALPVSAVPLPQIATRISGDTC